MSRIKRHILILGITGVGKTTLANVLIDRSKTNNPQRQIWAYDPSQSLKGMNGRLPSASEVILHANRWRNVTYVIDDGPTIDVSQQNELARWISIARQRGHQVIMISQTVTMVRPGIRSQCGDVHTFKIGGQQSALLAEEFAAPGLAKASELPPRQWLHYSVDTCEVTGPWQIDASGRIRPASYKKTA